jgi:predicted metalloprotease with PDZ domain
VSAHPPADELARAGWRFAYTDKPNLFITANQADDHGITGWYAYGANLTAEGVVRDVREGSPAWRAGLAPEMHVLAVDNQEFSPDVFEYALRRAQHSAAPISLITSQTGWFQTLSLDYHEGIRYPHLERVEGTPDMLAAIAAPHAK